MIQTHRDPLRTVPSAISTVATGRFLRSDDVDIERTAASVTFGFTMMLNGVAEQRAAGALPESQIADLHYLDLLQEPVDAISAAYDRLGMSMDDQLAGRIREYLAERPQHKHGAHHYSLRDFGLEPDELRTQLAPYIETFGVIAEPGA